MRYGIEELGDFLVIRVVGNMTAKDKPGVLIEAINEYVADGKIRKFLFDLENVDDIDDDGIDVFINCLSLQNSNVEDRDITWAENLDESKIENELAKGLSKDTIQILAIDDEDDEDDDDDMYNLADVYKEAPNAPITDCFILVMDDDVYDKLHDFGVSELMTVYRTREDFTRDYGVVLED